MGQKFHIWNIIVEVLSDYAYVPDMEHEGKMPTAITVEEEAKRFGNLIRTRRKALGMRQEDIVFATGVGRRYLIDLEAGKPTSWIGPALMIARHLGIEFVDSSSQDAENSGYDYDLPELKDEENNSAQAESE
ncbi:MAG TPA: hypothetical protein DHV56_00435 [Rhodobacter sp.]|jgi:DNA-binding XRE family transcriptional regulator|nr:hypothetical protein [Rhodobacter sp.]